MRFAIKRCFCMPKSFVIISGFFAEDAFDIVSEAFFKCFNKIEQFRRGCLFSSRVCGFVRNIAF